MPLITLLTDFGLSDPYVGVMKGVILRINPKATIVDLCHQVQPQAIKQAAFLLGHSYRYFPKETVHVAVVDPGVGTMRLPILLVTSEGLFVGPDNGIFSPVVTKGFKERTSSISSGRVRLPSGFKAFHLTNQRYWLHPVSATFHGRDIFASVAAHLTLGTRPEELGEQVDSIIYIPMEPPSWKGSTLTGEVMHIDRFGNLVTNIPAGLVTNQQVQVDIKGCVIKGLSTSYEAGGELLAIVGSFNTLEIASYKGNAATLLQAGVGERVVVRRLSYSG